MRPGCDLVSSGWLAWRLLGPGELLQPVQMGKDANGGILPL